MSAFIMVCELTHIRIYGGFLPAKILQCMVRMQTRCGTNIVKEKCRLYNGY
jgi:hypothetical protein